MAKKFVRDEVPLSRFAVLVAQLESIVASATHKSPDPLLCFDLISDLISAIDQESKDSILLCQRKCEDALYSLLVLGARKPVRHLASVAVARIIQKGDSISIYSRASSLQGFLSDGKKSEAQRIAGVAECLGELYRYFGRRITSGLLETTTIVAKLLKFNEEFVREEALQMLQNALEGSGGGAAASAYADAFRIIMRSGIVDKSSIVRVAAARCLKAFASIGGPGLGVGELDNASSSCVKALEDPILSVRDAFAEALGALLGLGMNPDAQVQPRGKAHFTPKKLDGGLERHLTLPFVKATGPRAKVLRVGLTLSWVSFLQAIRLKYLQPDTELEKYIFQVMDMLRADSLFDAQALACILYILRVGITDQMSEPTQRGLLVILGNQLQSPDATPSMRVAALRTMSYALRTLGEVPAEFKEVFDNTVVYAVSHRAPLVRVEAALTLRAIAEVDPTCIGGLISYAITMLGAVRENISFEKVKNDPLSKAGCGKDVRHFEFEAVSSTIEYEVGDVVHILPGQDAAAVDAFIKRCNLNPESYIRVEPKDNKENEQSYDLRNTLKSPVRLKTFVELAMDVASASPRRYFFEVMSYFATAEHEKERLQYFASPEGRDDLYEYNQKERRTVLEVLEDFPSVQMPFEWLVQLVPPLKTRAFSISSSHSAHPNQVHLTVSVVSWTTPYKRKRTGLCSSWLAELDPQKRVLMPAWFQKGSLPAPPPSLPLILVGPGTGCAPFRGFVEERALQSQSGPTAPVLFFFGCRNEENDFLYRDFWMFHSQKGGVLSEEKGGGFFAAFSRDQQQKVYVQHKMREESFKIWNLLTEGAAVYVAGSANKMPSDVLLAFEEIVSKEGAAPKEAAVRWLRALEKVGKYHVEAWS